VVAVTAPLQTSRSCTPVTDTTPACRESRRTRLIFHGSMTEPEALVMNWSFWMPPEQEEVARAFAARLLWVKENSLFTAGEKSAVRWFDALARGEILFQRDGLTIASRTRERPIARIRLLRLGGSLLISCAGFPDAFETRLVSVIASDLGVREWRLDVEHQAFTATLELAPLL